MRIRNLGPITDVQIQLNELTMLMGDNGTGKTLAAYSVFAFRNWLEQNFTAQLVTKQQVQAVLNGQTVTKPFKAYVAEIAAQVVEQFNRLNQDGHYFQAFFRDPAVYRVGTTRIEVTAADILSATGIAATHVSHLSWPYRGDNQLGTTNRIVTKYDQQTQQVAIYYADQQDRPIHEELENTPDVATIAQTLSRGISHDVTQSAGSSVYLPAERIGINTFRTKLNHEIINEQLATPTTSDAAAPQQATGERYPYPIESYIKFLNNALRNMAATKKTTGEPAALQTKLIPGQFSYDSEDDRIHYQLDAQPVARPIGFNLLSSSLKSLFGVDLFLNRPHAESWLFIDEPEMNLHPARQKLMADLLYQLMLTGQRLFVSTHSDVLVKEMVNQVLASAVAKDGGDRRVSVYLFRAGTAQPIDLFNPDDFGNFDRTTDEINDTYDNLLDQLEK